MERLTKRIDENHLCIKVCEEACIEGNTFCPKCKPFTAVLKKLMEYEDLEEQGLLLKLPCKVGDVVYLIDEDENRHLRVYEGVWTRVSVVQRNVDGNFELCGHISYDIYDCFYNDGRTMKHGMYVGQDRTKVGEIVFLTKAEAEKALIEMRKEQHE